MALHFVADLHFNGDSAAYAIPYGLADCNEMARRICDVWRARVAPDDSVWIIGNVGNPVHLTALPGIKHLVRAPGDPQLLNCLNTRQFASVSDIQHLETPHGLFTLVSNPMHAIEEGARVLHGRVSGPWTRPGHLCVAASEIGWGPVSLDVLIHGHDRGRLNRAA